MKHDPDALAFPIAALGGLGRDGIHDLWRRLHRKPPPKGVTGELLLRALAWRLQCLRDGGVPRGTEQRLARAARVAMRELADARKAADTAMNVGKTGQDASGPARPRRLRAGTRLLREWQGNVHEVTVLSDGFLWNGQSHRSLSVIAKAITGTSWNGWLFFGLTDKPARKAGVGVASATPEQTLKRPSRLIETGVNKGVATAGARSQRQRRAPTIQPPRTGSLAHG